MTGLEAHHRWVGRGWGRLGGCDKLVVRVVEVCLLLGDCIPCVINLLDM